MVDAKIYASEKSLDEFRGAWEERAKLIKNRKAQKEIKKMLNKLSEVEECLNQILMLDKKIDKVYDNEVKMSPRHKAYHENEKTLNKSFEKDFGYRIKV